MNRLLMIAFAAMISGGAQAQKLTLQQCIDLAIKNNIQVRQSSLAMESADINRKQARYNLLPDLNANIGHGINQGRSIDPFTNQYATQQINYAGYGVNSGVVLFNGMNLQNIVKQNAYAYDASKMEWQQVKDNLTLNIILAYLKVLNSQDIITSTQAQAELSKKQLERLEVMDKQGAINPSLVAELKGQLINDQISVINARTELETSRLNLSQLMNIPYANTLQVERLDTESIMAEYSKTPDEVYQSALNQFALIKAADLRTKSAAYALKATRGSLFPTVFFNANANTNFSSAALNAAGKIPYSEQLNNNVFTNVNIGLNIPIFNSLRARNRIKLAAIEVKNTELQEENTKLLVRQQIEQSSLMLANSFERYKALLEQVAAYKMSFNAAEVRFNAGLGTSVEYLVAKNNLERASINLISSKYDFLLRKQVVDYYAGVR